MFNMTKTDKPKTDKPKLIVIVGTNASGKSALGVQLAKDFNGEIVSADSRQVYKGLNIGTGKVTKREMRGIPHHLIDVTSPSRRFDVTRFQNLARKTISDIRKRGKLPIIVGGTGYFIDAIMYNQNFPEVKPNIELRKKLRSKTPAQLFEILNALDPKRAKSIERENPRRLIRAIEITTALGAVPKMDPEPRESEYHILWLGIRWPDEVLRKRIHTRLFARKRAGMIAEAKRLHSYGISYKRMEELGLEYKFLAYYLQGRMSKEEMLKKLETAIWQYARRQKTWFKRNKKIIWLNGIDLNNSKKLARRFCES